MLFFYTPDYLHPLTSYSLYARWFRKVPLCLETKVDLFVQRREEIIHGVSLSNIKYYKGGNVCAVSMMNLVWEKKFLFKITYNHTLKYKLSLSGLSRLSFTNDLIAPSIASHSFVLTPLPSPSLYHSPYRAPSPFPPLRLLHSHSSTLTPSHPHTPTLLFAAFALKLPKHSIVILSLYIGKH